MPIQAVLDETSFSSLDEPLKTLYVQNSANKQFYLDMPETEAEKLAFNLQSKFESKKADLDRLHAEKKQFETDLTAFKKLGKTPQEIQEFINKNRPEDVAKTLAEKDTEIQSIHESYKTTIDEANTKATTYQQQLYRNAVETTISRLRAEYNLTDVADAVLKDFIRAEEKDGQVITRIYENGEPAKVAGLDKTPEQLLKGFQDSKKFLSMFSAGESGGTGLGGQQRSLGGKQTMKRSEYDQRLTAGESFTSFFASGGQIID